MGAIVVKQEVVPGNNNVPSEEEICWQMNLIRLKEMMTFF